MPEQQPYIFLSYKHAPKTTAVTERFYDMLKMYSKGLGLAGVFMDKKSIQAGNVWRQEVIDALARCTHFVIMLSNGYWLSGECHKELETAVARFRRKDGIRLLFVQVEEIAPELLYFNETTEDANVAFVQNEFSQLAKDEDRTLEKVGDLQFLGPFDEYARLIRLPTEEEEALDDALSQLVQRLRDTLPSAQRP